MPSQWGTYGGGLGGEGVVAYLVLLRHRRWERHCCCCCCCYCVVLCLEVHTKPAVACRDVSYVLKISLTLRHPGPYLPVLPQN